MLNVWCIERCCGGQTVSSRFWIVLFIILFFGWGIYADYSVEIARFFAGNYITSVTQAGAWGDTFGAFNGLVSLAGAIFIVRTLLLQQDALAEQQKAISFQVSDAHRQRFEASFFELLKLLRELRGELSFKHSKAYVATATTATRRLSLGRTRAGTDALAAFILEQRFILRSQVKDTALATREDLAKSYDAAMTTQTERTFAPYFRLIYTILNKVRKDGVLSAVEKSDYTRLLRSQITNIELIAIAYNSLSPRSADLESLLTEFRMFKYMPESPARKRFERIFEPQIFLSRD